MRVLLTAALAVFLALGASAQTIPAKGTEATFDIASWNVENFGQGSGAATERANVAAVIRQADIDLWALQEVVDPRDFVDLVDDLRGDGYNGVLGPDPGGGGQRLAYIYNESVVTLVAARTIPDFNGDSFAFAGRIPYEFRASVTVGGETRSIRFINIHAKAFSDAASYNRRVDAANALKDYLDPLEDQGLAIVLLGDYNDRLNQSTRSGFLSPYRPFFVREDEYTFATRSLDPDGVTFCSNSSCTSGSPIDHIMFTSALTAEYEAGSGEAFAALASAIPSYRSTSADHLPVLDRFAFRSTSAEADPEAGLALRP
ncbi:MAG: endonuclease/exonuclease/phosphatase family protein, partial [Bacteroidota bacterium]